MILLQLLFAFVRIGLFAFGGGYATLPLIEKIIINELHLLSYSEFLELVTISQLTPGPIAINAATYVGYKADGILGATVATLGVCLPSVVIILVVVRFLKKFAANVWIDKIIKGLRPAVITLIAAAAISIVVEGSAIGDIKGIIIAVMSFLVLRSRKVDPVLVLILAGVGGILAYL